MIVCVHDPEVIHHIEESVSQSPPLEYKVLAGSEREGWINFSKGKWRRVREVILQGPGPDEAVERMTTTCFFISLRALTGMPKMLTHDYTYPLGHILTAKYCSAVQDNGPCISL